jgi:hypothetical protein
LEETRSAAGAVRGAKNSRGLCVLLLLSLFDKENGFVIVVVTPS